MKTLRTSLLLLVMALFAAIPAHAQTVPTGLAAGSPASKVNLNWTASPPVTGVTIAGYDVFRSTTSGGEAGTPALNGSTPITGTTFTDSTGVPGMTYFYVISAQSTAGKLSAFSNEATAAIPANPAPPVLGVVTFSIVNGPNNTKIIAAAYTDASGAQTAYQLWSGSTLLKSGTPAIAANGAYSFSWKVKKALLTTPSLTIEDAAGNVSTSVVD